MKKILFALVTLIPFLSYADEPVPVDTVVQQSLEPVSEEAESPQVVESAPVDTLQQVAKSAPVVRQLTTPPFTPKGTAGKKGKIEYPAAVDNSVELLAKADSLSRLYDKYARESRLYMPITFF